MAEGDQHHGKCPVDLGRHDNVALDRLDRLR